MNKGQGNNVFIAITKILNEKILSPWRWQLLLKRLSPYIGDTKTILDVGVGDGGLSSELLKIHKISIKGIDPHPQDKTFIPIIWFDGITIPFKDKTFDMAMINDVLHHDNHPEIILSEAKRVAKKYVLVKDHYFTNLFDFFLLKWTDYLGNASYGVNLPYNYLTIDSWKKLFKELGLSIVSLEMFRYNILDPSNHVIFLLEETNRNQGAK